MYSIIIDSCSEETIGEILGNRYQCRTGAEIGQFYSNVAGTRVFQIYFLNILMNFLDYKNPNKQYIFRLESPFSSTQFSSNDLNFNPSLLKTHKGLVFDVIKQDISYSFDRNDVYIGDRNQTPIFISYTFFLKNIMNYYERYYKRVQEIISSIGGIYKFITIVAIYINSLYSNYIILSDTFGLLHSSKHLEKNKIEIKRNSRKNNSYNLRDDEKDKKDNETKIKSNIKNAIKSSERKKLDKLDKLDYTNIQNSKIINDNSKSNNNILEENTQPNIDLNNKKDNLEKTDDNIKKMDTKMKVEKKKSFCSFLIYKITCRKKFKYYNVYRDFRMKIISEEHLIKNHLNIYNLMKVTEKKRFYKRNSYQLKDLIKLV